MSTKNLPLKLLTNFDVLGVPNPDHDQVEDPEHFVMPNGSTVFVTDQVYEETPALPTQKKGNSSHLSTALAPLPAA